MGPHHTVQRRSAGTQRLAWLLTVGLGGSGCAGGKGEGTAPGECTDGIDNDENGQLDCKDSGCYGSPDCAPDDSAAPIDSGEPIDTGTPAPTVPADWADAFDWITVPAGDFAMGATESELEDREDDEFPRTVTHTYDYVIATTEVPVSLWAAATQSTPDLTCGESCPVTGLSWHAAAQLTVALSHAAGLDGCYSCTGSGADAYCVPLSRPQWCSGVRLPTEAEWERAARADAGTVYAGSDDVALVGWIDGTSGGVVQPPGLLQANAWGGFDFSGNVAEWCHDLWQEMPSAEPEDQIDPIGPTIGEHRNVRGGGFDQPADNARAAHRAAQLPDHTAPNLGLRLVRTLDP